jgi:outer membrane protein TolC
LPNPTISLGSEYDLSRANESPWLWSLTTDWLLDAGLRRQLRVKLADTHLRAARFDYAEAVWTVRSELRAALLSYLLSRQRQQVLNETVASQERLLSLLQQRVKHGEAAASDALPVQLELARARAAVSDNTAKQSQALSQLAQTLGMPVSSLSAQQFSWSDLIHVTSVDDVQLNKLREQALLSRADLERAVLDYQTRELELHQAVRQQYPQLSIGPGYIWDHGIRKVSLGLSFSLPVFNRNQGPIAEAEAQRNSTGEQALAVQAQILNAIDAARQAYQAEVQMIETVLQQNDAADSVLQQAMHAQALGATDRATVVAAQVAANTERLAVLDAVERMQQALGKLEDALRTPLSGPETTMGAAASYDVGR